MSNYLKKRIAISILVALKIIETIIVKVITKTSYPIR